MARQVLENGVVLPAEYSDDWYDDMTSNLTKLDDVIGSDSEKLSSADVGAAALSNNYNDLDNLPTIPTVNDATLTIQKNGSTVKTFTANASSNVTCNITVPTKTSELTNDSGFLTSHQSLSSCVKNVVTNNQTIKSTSITRGTAPSSAQTFGIAFSDNNDKYICNIYGSFATNMSTFVGLYVYKGTTTLNGDNASIRVGYDTSGNAYTYAPTPATADNSTQIATTAFVKAQGYLGMPDLDNGIDISSYITHLDKVVNNYTPPSNGWLSIRLKKTSLTHASLMMYQTGGLLSSCETTEFSISGTNLPVIANQNVEIYIYADSLASAKFYPCQGNV